MTSHFQHNKLYRTLISISFFTFSLILAFLLKQAAATEVNSEDCIGCHQEQYQKAISYKYQHSILKEACTHCHVRKTAQGETKTVLTFSTFQKEQIVHLEDLDPEEEYEAEVTVTDNRGKRCLPKRLKMDTEKLWKRSVKFPKLEEISNVSVDELQKSGFVRAIISWDTNAYSTSELEFSTEGSHTSRFNPGSIFARKHRVILSGLRHRSLYNYKVISRDIYGNFIESKDYSLDTSKTIPKSGNNKYQPPVVTNIQAFSLEGEKGLFLKVFANKPAELTVKLIEVNAMDTKHGFGLLDPRVVRIDTCIKCHPRGTSHPVGVKAEGGKIRTPDELPTIEDGIITCVTCHNPHGGDNAFFARFDRNKDICILCHIGGYWTND